MSRRTPPCCPDCAGAPTGVPVVFGFPSSELFEAAERGEVVLGGCILDGAVPEWACPDCHRYLGWSSPDRDAITVPPVGECSPSYPASGAPS